MTAGSRKSLSISVIIPTYNDNDALCALLSDLSSLKVTEIIIVDAGNAEDRKSIAGESANASIVVSNKGRGQQIATGIAKAQSDIVWVLHADSRLPNGAMDEIQRIMRVPNVALGCFPIRFEAPHPALKLFGWLSRFDSVVTTFGDQGFFCKRSDYLSFGNGSSHPLLEDLAFRRFLLARKKGRVLKSNLKITTSARRFKNQGPIKTQLINLGILWRYFRGTSPTELYKDYYYTPKSEHLKPSVFTKI